MGLGQWEEIGNEWEKQESEQDHDKALVRYNRSSIM